MKCWISGSTLGNISSGILERPRVLQMVREPGESRGEEVEALAIFRQEDGRLDSGEPRDSVKSR